MHHRTPLSNSTWTPLTQLMKLSVMFWDDGRWDCDPDGIYCVLPEHLTRVITSDAKKATKKCRKRAMDGERHALRVKKTKLTVESTNKQPVSPALFPNISHVNLNLN